jgi:hypothetical protein
MKVYPEEELRRAIGKSRLADGFVDGVFQLKYTIDEVLEQSLPIELPSGLNNITIQHQYHSSKKFYIDAGFVDCTIEQYESIKKELPNCPLNKVIKITPIELPSDEEIEVERKRYGVHGVLFSDGAKWIKKQILNQNK